jgi:hypothetical protein
MIARIESSSNSSTTASFSQHKTTSLIYPPPTMKFTIAAVVSLLPLLSSAHCIAQRVRVNGQDFGQGTGIRMSTSNNPIQNVNDGSFACKNSFQSPVSSKVIDVKAGDKVGVMWGHVIGGAQYANDVDNPIASSHKGPTIFYMYVLMLRAFSFQDKDQENNTHTAAGQR